MLRPYRLPPAASPSAWARPSGHAARDRLLDFARRALPQSCTLCAAPSASQLVCAACAAELPRNDRACEVCALPLAAGGRCGHCATRPPAYARTLAPFVYAFPVDRLVQSYKYQAVLALAGWFADAMLPARPAVAADVLVAMPLTRARQRQRGFNQSLELAKALSRATGVRLSLDAVERVRDAVPQATLPWAERRRNVSGAFACGREVNGLRIVVVDDVMTTGASLEEMARVLMAGGAASVENWVIARTPAPEEPWTTDTQHARPRALADAALGG